MTSHKSSDSPKANTKKDKKLAENVVKLLYDTSERTKVCIEWVSENCKLSRQKGRLEALKEVLEVIQNEIDIPLYDSLFLIKNFVERCIKEGEKK
jgi:hypothetical protein